MPIPRLGSILSEDRRRKSLPGYVIGDAGWKGSPRPRPAHDKFKGAPSVDARRLGVQRAGLRCAVSRTILSFGGRLATSPEGESCGASWLVLRLADTLERFDERPFLIGVDHRDKPNPATERSGEAIGAATVLGLEP